MANEIPSEFFSDWLTPDIVGKGLDVEIVSASNEIQSNEFEGRTVQSIASKVKYGDDNKEANFRINKTNGKALATVLETRDAEKWAGHKLHLELIKVLVGGKKKDSITISEIDGKKLED